MGDSESVTTAPVPLRVTTCALLLSAPVMLSEPWRDPVAVGVKVTWKVQLLLAATLVPQLLVCAKSPVMAMFEMATAAALALDKVTGCAGLVVATV